MSTAREQALVEAQVEINRAMFLMNARENLRLSPYNTMKPEEYSDDKIAGHIDEALKHLHEARQGYFQGQLSLLEAMSA